MLSSAISTKKLEIVKYLIEQGAKPTFNHNLSLFFAYMCSDEILNYLMDFLMGLL